MTTEIQENKIEAKKKKRAGAIVAVFVLILACIAFYTTLWFVLMYDDIRLDQILYQLKAPSRGTPAQQVLSTVMSVALWSILTAVGLLSLYLLLSGRIKKLVAWSKYYQKYVTTKVCGFFRKRYISLSALMMVIAVSFFTIRLEAISYVITINTPSDFIEFHYVKPEQSVLKFPEQKRNLIYILLESMENTYAQDPDGDGVKNDYIPELVAMADQYVNFSNNDGLGGALNYDGATWTAAALVSQTSGVPVKVPLLAENYGGEDVPYMPGIVSLGNILHEQGYKQEFLMGSVANFGGREDYITEHGNYEVLDLEAMIEAGQLPEGYSEWWGYEDSKLFAFAKEELLELSASNQPFNLSILTADTHFPDGYKCPDCKDKHDSQYANALACSSARVLEFVTWVQQQDFYENTTIVICGDHLTMDPLILENIDVKYTRTTYNCIINSAVHPVQEKNRQFGAFDMYPTTLAAMGVEIQGNRLALGTNLFSREKTLTELYGYEFLNAELQKDSEYYNEEILNTTEPKK